MEQTAQIRDALLDLAESNEDPKLQKNAYFKKKKKQFDESGSDEVKQSAEESFRVEYFIFIIDQALSSLRIEFEQFKQYGCICGKKFFKIEVDQNLSPINYVTRKIKQNKITNHSHMMPSNNCYDSLLNLSRRPLFELKDKQTIRSIF
ncbi:uncharacterized protein LOC111369021 [Olea europaea var. sylvestris]|uniref:uncharacterized protein LOC111369021 n=1 Tax=Olea europaea var. sylvestris TaxID=158386 RepID=UPI000C1D3E7A|nr:uncharacterized protein LOC111369021 [Olea europaea var. sylvestris]